MSKATRCRAARAAGRDVAGEERRADPSQPESPEEVGVLFRLVDEVAVLRPQRSNGEVSDAVGFLPAKRALSLR